MKSDFKFLDSMRLVGDAAADAIIASVFSDKKQSELYQYLQLPDDQVKKVKDQSPLRDFLLQPLRVPSWFDYSRIQNGQRFFKKYALDIMTLLGAMSLPYCYAATPGNKAIYYTGKMKKSPGKRLLETANFIISVMKENAFDQQGFGVIQINKTRLIHAMVRYHIQKNTQWNMAWGLPVNQEDMAGTNLAFSYIILAGLEKSKYPIARIEKEDFLFTWRYIGYQLHINEDLLPASYAEADKLEQVIRERNFKISEEGKILMNELLNHYKESFPALPAYFVDAQVRYFIGAEVSAILSMQPNPGKDSFIKTMNHLKETINRYYNNPSSYSTMLKNHEVLKRKYS